MALDKTEAVNLMLSAVGEQPVSAGEVTTPTLPEVVKAVRILDKVSRDLQTKEWSFNTVLDVTLTPSGGVITLAATIHTVEPHRRSNRLALRFDSGTLKLYDRDAGTFTFSGPIKAKTISELPFADLPITARAFITAQATRVFAERYLGEAQPALREDEKEAMATFYEAEIGTGNYRLSDSYDVGRTAGRISPADEYSG